MQSRAAARKDRGTDESEKRTGQDGERTEARKCGKNRGRKQVRKGDT